MAFEEDFGVFFNTDGFGDTFIYTPTVGEPVQAIGIFDDVYFAAPGGEVDIESSQPQLQYETATITGKPVYGEKIAVRGTDYVIVGVHPDGTGTTTLRLELADDPC